MAAIELYNTPLFSDSSLVAYYRAENNGNDSKSGLTMTAGGNATYTASGKFGSAFLFDGDGDYFRYNSVPASLLGNTDWTMMCYANLTATGNSVLMAFGSSSTDNGTFIILTDTSIRIGYWNRDIDTGIAPPFGAYHLYTVTKVGTVLKLYIDNVLRYTSANLNGASPNITAGGLQIGAQLTFTSESVNGAVDEGCFFSKGLSATEIDNYFSGNYGSSKFFQLF